METGVQGWSQGWRGAGKGKRVGNRCTGKGKRTGGCAETTTGRGTRGTSACRTATREATVQKRLHEGGRGTNARTVAPEGANVQRATRRRPPGRWARENGPLEDGHEYQPRNITAFSRPMHRFSAPWRQPHKKDAPSTRGFSDKAQKEGPQEPPLRYTERDFTAIFLV